MLLNENRKDAVRHRGTMLIAQQPTSRCGVSDSDNGRVLLVQRPRQPLKLQSTTPKDQKVLFPNARRVRPGMCQ